jgi:trehalose 6-phosphate phosphatase
MRKVLFVDFDDTLIEKQEDPTNFVLPTDLMQIAEKSLRSNDILVIVTGRSIEQIDAFFSPTRLNVIGCHGCVARVHDKRFEIVPPIPESLLLKLNEIVNEIACLYENKGYSFTLHVADDLIRIRVEEAVSFLSSRHQVKLFGSCIEVIPIDTNKGQAIKKIRPMLDDLSKEAASYTYIGDDAFADSSLGSLAAEGIKLVAVADGNPRNPNCFSSPNAVRKFLLNEFILSEQN